MIWAERILRPFDKPHGRLRGARNRFQAEKRPLRATERLFTFGLIARYTASMPIQFILPKKFTRAQIEWRMDELALQFQGTKDKKLLAQIAR